MTPAATGRGCMIRETKLTGEKLTPDIFGGVTVSGSRSPETRFTVSLPVIASFNYLA